MKIILEFSQRKLIIGDVGVIHSNSEAKYEIVASGTREFDFEYAEKCPTISNFMEELDDSETELRIKLPVDVNNVDVNNIEGFIKLHEMYPPDDTEIETPLIPIMRGSKLAEPNVPKLNVYFNFIMDIERINHFMSLANYLGITLAFEISCASMALIPFGREVGETQKILEQLAMNGTSIKNLLVCFPLKDLKSIRTN